MVLKLSHASESRGGLVKTHVAEPQPQIPLSVCLGIKVPVRLMLSWESHVEKHLPGIILLFPLASQMAPFC